MLTIQELKIEGFKKVIEASDPEAKLHCIIAIHNTTLGPALGGARIKTYESRDEALVDVLRLAKAMTYKSAIAGTGFGGGKSVVIAGPEERNDELLLAFGKAVDSLEGAYIVAEDVGSSTKDMEVIHRSTPYVAARDIDKSSGDPSRFTAWGVFKGMEATAKVLWGSPSLHGKVIAIQGLGNVGGKLAEILFWAGAKLILSEVNDHKLHEYANLYGAKTINTDQFCFIECDFLAPCALGGIVSPEIIPKLNCKAIVGGANNQFSQPSCGELLLECGILYAPDYIVNAGGLINVGVELSGDGYDPNIAREKVSAIYDIVIDILDQSVRKKIATNVLADQLAEYNLQHQIGKRQKLLHFD
ncbi:MAG: Glu/Leu/Phe/Val dehydrogenase [Parachlamydiaceae bacterium]|nr:Glu/Leu/Phe/Val dehydrogenase [Parachlamydiaceae bacterium]